MVRFAGNLLAARQQGFAVAQADRRGASFVPLHDAGNELPDLLEIFVVQGVAFGFANFLDDDLLGGLGDDAAHRLLGVESDAVVRARNGAVVPVDMQDDFLIFAILFFGGGDEGGFDCLKDNFFPDIFIAVDRVHDSQDFA